MLNLRQPGQTEARSASPSAYHRFSSFVTPDIIRSLAFTDLGNIGEPLYTGSSSELDATMPMEFDDNTEELDSDQPSSKEEDCNGKETVNVSVIACSVSSETVVGGSVEVV